MYNQVKSSLIEVSKIIDEITTEIRTEIHGDYAVFLLAKGSVVQNHYWENKKASQRSFDHLTHPQLKLHFSLVHSSCIGSPLELSPLCVHTLLATLPLKFNDAPTLELSLEKNSIFSVYLPFVKV